MSDYILGLDLGPNSIGWALVSASFDSGEPLETGLLDTSAAGHPPLGVRVFEEGLENFGTSKEKSLAQERRTKRSLRRLLARRRARKDALRQALQEVELLPHDQDALAKVIALDPYRLRAEALDRALRPEELGRALFHLAQRRGFKSNRKTAKAKAADDRKTLKEMSALSEAIEASGTRTLGEYLFRESQRGNAPESDGTIAPVHRGEVRLRGRYARQDLFVSSPRRARRDHYIEEFRAILDAQRRLTGMPILSPEHEKRVHDVIFFQRDFAISEERRLKAPPRANLHRAPQLKPCPLEPDERRARRSDWIAQRFRILKEVNNLRVIERGWKERRLTEEERQRLLALLSEQKEVRFDRMRNELQDLGLPEDTTFNLERGSREKLDGNEVDATLAGALGKTRWRGLQESERQELRDLIESTEDEAALQSELERRGIPAKGIEKLLKLGPEDRYLAYSRKALGKLVPLLEQGFDEFGAIARAYPESGEAKVWQSLPSLVAPGIPPDIANVTNPIVRRALVEVRKVVNAIVRQHGRPRRIVIELARAMRQGRKARAEHAKSLHERAVARSAAREHASELLHGRRAGRAEVDRYLLWKEQGTFCLYTGRPIAQELLFSDEIEVDHILPRWASLDDSRPNKVLCFRTANDAKRKRTPAEWLGVEGSEYEQLLARAEDHCKRSGLPWGVLARLRQEHVDADDFAARQLNDTRYISRLVGKYLGLLFPAEARVGQKAILTSRGSLTAELRHQWGLGDVLDPLLDANGNQLPDYEERDGRRVKLRIDHRHHAIDALVVALSSRSRLKRYQDYWQRVDWGGRGAGQGDVVFNPPWRSLRGDAAREAAAIRVSHRVSRKIAGPLHADLYYGAVRQPNGQVLEGVYVTRKNLDELTADVINDASGRTGIVDRQVREAIIDRLRGVGWDGGRQIPKDWWRAELRLPSRVPVRRVRIRVAIGDAISLGHRFAASQNNHHIAFDPIREPGSPLTARVRPMIDVAAGARRRGEQLLASDKEMPSALFPVARALARNELVEVSVPGTGRRVLAVVQTLSGGRESSTKIDVRFRDARDARPATTGNKTPLMRACSTDALLKWDVRKVQVDPLGRLLPAGD